MTKLLSAVAAPLLLAGAGDCAFASDPSTAVVFMLPVEDGGSARRLPRYQRVDDAETLQTYAKWLDNESAEMALALYDLAWTTMQRRGEGGDIDPPPPYHVAIVDGGNHADVGFRLHHEGDEVETHAKLPYIKLSPRPFAFENTLLHETGHVVLAVLAGGRRVPARPIASIPHTTAALTDRGTAFNEGFAIHLETLAAHLVHDDRMDAMYRHGRYEFGGSDWRNGEYFRHAVDLRSYSQTIARYYEVRENNFAFAPAFNGPDYLRVQLEKARDFAALMDANQLLQSEGFYASVFFAWTVRGDAPHDVSTVADRQTRMLDVLAEMFASHPPDPETPHLLRFVETHMSLYPDEAEAIVDLVLDMSHGVFVDPDAADLWREAYLAALALDVEGFPPPAVVDARARWREMVLADPGVLHSRLGPQIRCTVPDRTVRLVAFGQPAPVSFDVNTVQEGIIRMIPEMTDAVLDRWLAERAGKPFTSAEDFKERMRPEAPALAYMEF